MADRFYGLDRGEQLVEQVTEGAASTPSTDVEIRINLDAGLSRLETLLLIDIIKYAILRGNWPPAV